MRYRYSNNTFFYSYVLLLLSIDAAIDLFSKARPPGIYKQDYIDELLKKFGDETPGTISAPPRPDWCTSKKSFFLCISV